MATDQRLEHIFKYMNYDVLTDWEQRFVEDMEKRFRKGFDLSTKQDEILERIFREAEVR